MPKQGILDSKTLHKKLRCQQLNFCKRPFPKRWLQKMAKKPILRIFQTELLIVMDLQDIPLNIFFRVMNLKKKYFRNSLLFNKSVKIQDGFQLNSMIHAAEFFQCYIINY